MTDPSTIPAAKFALRQAMLARRAALLPDLRHAAAAALADQTSALAAMAKGMITSGFCAFRDEIDPMPLLCELAGRGQTLALPRVAGAHLTFHRWSPGDALTPGRYGIPEPLPGTAEVRPALMLVPLLAFDRRGHRLGYGAGFFDRVLADHRPDVTIGVAYAMQELDEVPTEPHDQPLDFILTELGLIDCRASDPA